MPADWRVGTRPTSGPGGRWFPIGDHKGAGLALLGELLSGVLSGGPFLSGVWNGGNAKAPQVSHALVALGIEAFQPLAEFEATVNGLVDEIHAASPAPGVERVLVPGELEHESEQRGLRDGIEFDATAWHVLIELADEYGLRYRLEATAR